MCFLIKREKKKKNGIGAKLLLSKPCLLLNQLETLAPAAVLVCGDADVPRGMKVDEGICVP